MSAAVIASQGYALDIPTVISLDIHLLTYLHLNKWGTYAVSLSFFCGAQ